MRVLMIAGVAGKAEAGGAGVVFNLANELRRLGHSVAPKFFEDLLPKQRWPARFRTVEFASRIADYVEETKSDYDVVNIHAPYGFWYGFRRRRRGAAAGPPYVVTMHGLEERRNYAMGLEAQKGRAHYFRMRNRIWQRTYHMRTYRWSFKTADQCIVLNREALLFLQLLYKLPPDRVSVVPNGVGMEFFQSHTHVETARPKLLFVGTWIDHKGIYTLAEAFEQLIKLQPGVQLTIAGCALSEDAVRPYFSREAQGAIKVLSFVARQDMPALYAQHDIFVLPSLVEGMPLVLLEAMASTLAVVTTESSGMTDLVEDGYDGILTIPGNSSSLLRALIAVCRDADLRQSLGAAAMNKMKRYTWERSARRHEAVFLRALGIQPETNIAAREQKAGASINC